MSSGQQPSPEDYPGGILRKRRLLRDIKELIEEPYPNITIHVHDDRLSEVCLVLAPAHFRPLHLTVQFPADYPTRPPIIKMNSRVRHPNVFHDHICASILKRGDREHTPAYTLKGIAIQMLSFFCSDNVEQDYGRGNINLNEFAAGSTDDNYRCHNCHFGDSRSPQPKGGARLEAQPNPRPTLEEATREVGGMGAIDQLPDETLLQILSKLDFENLTKFAAASHRVSKIIREYDVVRQRELQCFCLKKDYRSVKLGVGVHIEHHKFASEFDLLSKEAFDDWHIRRSVNHLQFEYWLPLPIYHPHWRRVKDDVGNSLQKMVKSCRGHDGRFGSAQVIFTFMNDVVVRLNQEAEGDKSNLRYASEKAIDSYFHLFHLLVCMAEEDPSLVKKVNALVQNFKSGNRSKTDCSNLGHLLIALLISDVEVTEDLMRSIITEAITRNVVWLFDKEKGGANMPELSYLEPDPVSAYRLDKTFQGSRTSYRILMFSELFRRAARPSHQKPLSEVRDELFVRHGAPPHGAAQVLAETVRRLQTIDNFPAFLKEMGLVKIPDPQTLTGFLRNTVKESMSKGYHTSGMGRQHALLLRRKLDPQVQMTKEDAEWVEKNRQIDPLEHRRTFWPPEGHASHRRKGGYRGQ